MAPRGSTVTLASGLALSYVEDGDPSGPAVVFLPGPTDAPSSYRAVLEHMPGSIRTIAVAQRGHDDSDKPAAGYRVEDFASDVVPLLDALEIERAVLVGHSGSCLVTRRVAIDHPERVAGLVLEAAPTTLAGNEALETFVSTVVSELRDPIDVEFARSVVVDTSSEAVDPALVDELTQDLLKVPAHVWQEMFGALLTYDDTPELARITAPCLLIWGDADALVPREMQDLLVDRLQRAVLRVYEGIGHAPRWEDPRRFAADVTAFVQSVL